MAVRCVTKRFPRFDVRSGVGIASLVRSWRKHVPHVSLLLTSSLEHPYQKHHRWGKKRHKNLANSIAEGRYKITRSLHAGELTLRLNPYNQLASAFGILLMMTEISLGSKHNVFVYRSIRHVCIRRVASARKLLK